MSSAVFTAALATEAAVAAAFVAVAGTPVN